MGNKYIKRNIDDDLLAWKNEKNRKVLLLRGARQIGKSSSVRKLAERFENLVEVNFELHTIPHTFFDSDLIPQEICNKLSIYFKQPIIPNKTLLFFDEIQACPRAISALRFFYENYPELHLVAAGSLLEFALEELPSFGVGRISSVFMHPFSFSEFMIACGEELLWNEVCKSSPKKPMLSVFHEKVFDYYRKFLVLGGMPAVISEFVESRDILTCQKILNDLVNSLKSDFAKYKKKIPDLQILAAFESVIEQAGGKFKYSKVEHFNSRQIKECVELLKKAGLIIPVIHSSANGIPLGAEIDFKKQKYILFDTGIFQRILDLELSDILFSNDFDIINKGFITEQMVGLEILKNSSILNQDHLYYWHKEDPKSSAEVDYIIQKGERIIPIEVKAGGSGKMQSMFEFLKIRPKCEYGIRTALENFSSYDKIRVYPLYAIGNLLSDK